jgi:MFS family permease
LLIRDRSYPQTDRGHFAPKSGSFESFRMIFRNKDMNLLLMIFFIGLGLFNAITTYVDLLLASKGFITGGNESGLIGAVMMGSGILGAIVVPVISDRIRKRKAVLVFCLAGLIPGLAGLAFTSAFLPIVISSGVFGFFIMGAAPVGFQYAAEVSSPVPESVSLGLILLSGQVSGILLIVLMGLFGNVTIEALADPSKASDALSLTPFMVSFVVLALINLFLGLALREYRPEHIKP